MNKVWDDLSAELKENPFFHFSEQTSYVPAWDKIRPEHFLPAMDYAIALMMRNVQRITDNKAKPNFGNTIEALEQADEIAAYFLSIMDNLPPGTGEAEKEYDRLTSEARRRYNKAYSEIYGENKKLYDRVVAVTKQYPASRKIPPAKRLLLESTDTTFTNEGIKLSPKKKAKVRALAERITELETKSQKNMKMAGESALLFVDDPQRLKGLSEFMIRSAAKKAEEAGQPGKWAFGLGKGTYTPFMQTCEDRELRKQLWQAYSTQATSGEFDNRATILELVRLQHQQARLVGHRHTAAQNLESTMAEKSRRVAKFLGDIRDAALPVARREIAELKSYARKHDHVKLEQWDVEFYKEKMKKEVLGYDEEQLRPYFELENTLKGVFRHYEKLFGIRFEETKDHPVYHPEVRAFNVYHKGSHKPAGIVFMDLFARDGKTPGIAWDSTVLDQGLFEGKVRRPIDLVVTKFEKGEPTLLQHYDLLVLLHEIGHATHNLLSKCRYHSLAGFNVDGDFVEFPSQFQENYGFEPAVLDDIAVHYQTGEKMPDWLKQKISDSQKFMAGTAVLEKTAKGWIDLSWYRADPERITSVEAFERAATAQYQLLPRRGAVYSPANSYLFGGGYESTYYSYQWSQIMEADVFAAFKEKGLYDRSLSASFKRILEHGGSEWPAKLFREFRHRVPLQKYFLARNGLLTGEFNYAADPQAADHALALAPTPAQATVEAAGQTAPEGNVQASAADPQQPSPDLASAVVVPPPVNQNKPREETIDDLFATPRTPRRGGGFTP